MPIPGNLLTTAMAVMPHTDADRALFGVIPHTTATCGSQFEVRMTVPFLSEGAFPVQGIQAIPPSFAIGAEAIDARLELRLHLVPF